MHKFSQKLKLELAHVRIERSCCAKAELSAIFKIDGSIDRSGKKFDLKTELPAVARRTLSIMALHIKSDLPVSYLSDLRKKIQAKRSAIDNELVHKKKTTLRFQLDGPILQVLEEIGLIDQSLTSISGVSKRIVRKKCCRSAYLRGLIMSCGYVSDPRSSYQLEMNTPDLLIAENIADLLSAIGIQARVQSKSRYYAVYIKRFDDIAKILSEVQAYEAFLEYENQHMFKEMKGTANRQVNCDSYNLSRSLRAATYQLTAINWLAANNHLDTLPGSLKEIATLRLENPEADTAEIGALFDPPITKQAAYHRLKRLLELFRSYNAGSIKRIGQ